MKKISNIGYCDFSGGALNFVRRGKRGDCEISLGCQECWALAIGERFGNLPETTTWYPEKLAKLARMKFPEFSPKRGKPYRPMVFPCATGDLFHEHVSSDFIDEALCLMHQRDDVVWQILTKRPQRMRACVEAWMALHDTYLHEYIWLGVSVESPMYYWRIKELLKIDTAMRFVSLEPMLEPMGLQSIDELCVDTDYCIDALSGDVTWFEKRDIGSEPMGEPGPALDWVIVGFESGPNRRPGKIEWAADILRQCQEADVACFLKQDSALHPGKPLIVDGREWKEWPEVE